MLSPCLGLVVSFLEVPSGLLSYLSSSPCFCFFSYLYFCLYCNPFFVLSSSNNLSSFCLCVIFCYSSNGRSNSLDSTERQRCGLLYFTATICPFSHFSRKHIFNPLVTRMYYDPPSQNLSCGGNFQYYVCSSFPAPYSWCHAVLGSVVHTSAWGLYFGVRVVYMRGRFFRDTAAFYILYEVCS